MKIYKVKGFNHSDTVDFYILASSMQEAIIKFDSDPENKDLGYKSIEIKEI